MAVNRFRVMLLDTDFFIRPENNKMLIGLKELRRQVDQCIVTPKISNEIRLQDVIHGFQDLRVTAVNLTAAHWNSMDPADLQSTLDQFRASGLPVFGAAPDLSTAERPYRMSLPGELGGGALLFRGLSRGFDRRSRGGAASGEEPFLVSNSVAKPVDENSRPDEFHVALPHWGETEGGRSFEQYRDAYRLLRNEYSLVVGQGALSVQEIERQRQRWVVYGLGQRGLAGNSKQADGEVASLIPVLEVFEEDSRRKLILKLYPISQVGSEMLAMSSEDALSPLIAQQSQKATTAWRFDNPGRVSGVDELGPHIGLHLGDWRQGHPPSLLPPLGETSDPGIWTPERTPVEFENAFLDMNRISMGASMMALYANRNGGSAEWISERQAVISCGKKRFIAYGYVSYESALGVSVCSDKVLTARFLKEARVRTPETQLVNSEDHAVEVARQLGRPVVVKPSDGKKSRGVTTNLVDEDAVREAFRLAREHGSQIIVQEYIRAQEEIRVMAASEGAFAVLKRVLPHVVGDGVSSIGQLIDDKNLQRELNPSMRSRSIPKDAATELQLRRQGYSLSTVPALGESVVVRNVAGLSAGADPHQAFEITTPKVKHLAADAVSAIPGLGWGGVDVILEEATGEPYVLEINTDAGYGQAMFPTYGEPRNVAETAWKLRIGETAEAPRGRARLPKPIQARTPVLEERLPSGDLYSRAYLSTLLWRFLERKGFVIEQLSPVIMKVSSPQGSSTLMTKTLMTAADRSSAVRIPRRHDLVRELLRLGDVRHAKGRLVSSSTQLKEYLEGFPGEAVLLPPRSVWRGRESKTIEAARPGRPRSMTRRTLVQKRPLGVGLSILVNQDGALTVITKEPDSINKSLVREGGRVAVKALRAVPELRWACVDVVVSAKGVGIVEGLSLNPRFTATDQVVAGSLHSFFRWLT